MFDCKKLTKTEREQARDAFALLCEYGYVGTSLMQRKLRIGYGRAAFLLDLFRYLELVDEAQDTRGRWPLSMAPRAAEDKLKAYLANHAEEDAPDEGWETGALSEEPTLNEGGGSPAPPSGLDGGGQRRQAAVGSGDAGAGAVRVGGARPRHTGRTAGDRGHCALP